MGWPYRPKTVNRVNTGAEPQRFYSMAYDCIVAGIPNSYLDQNKIIFKLNTMWFKHKLAYFNGATVIFSIQFCYARDIRPAIHHLLPTNPFPNIDKNTVSNF